MRRTADWLPGILLITVGAVLLVGQQLGLGGDVVVLAVGLVFLVAYAATRTYGLLVPAGILSGLGAAIAIVDRMAVREVGVLGLGLGFLGIYAVDALVTGAQRRWWPLIPGAILVTIAVSSGALGEQGRQVITLLWPIALIVAGALLLLRARPRQTG